MKLLLNISKAYVFVGFFCLGFTTLKAQDQRISDSLKVIFEKDTASGFYKLDLLSQLAFNERNDLELAFNYSELLILEAKRQNNKNALFEGYNQKGSIYRLLGNLDQALETFFKAAEVTILAENKQDEGGAYLLIADVYSEMGNSLNADIYYDKSIKILRTTKDKISLAMVLLNAGDEAFNTSDYKKALNYFEESGQIFKNENYLIGTAYNLGNIGMVYAEQGKNELAEQNINQAISILEDFEDYSAISEYLTYMSNIYVEKNDYTAALNYSRKSLRIVLDNNLKKPIGESNLKLYELHKAIGNTDSALYYHENYIVYRDSLRNIDNIERMFDTRTEFEVSQREAKLELAAQKSQTQLIILGFTGAILLSLTYFFIAIRKEKKKSDALLLNILPEETATELKKEGKVKAKKYESVSVLFTDFKGFTSYSEKLSPEELVKTVEYYFLKFDSIIEKYNLEKIKTIGDAYMCAGGLHHNKADHAQKIVAAALEIASFVDETKKNSASNELNFDIRLGINTGPVVAGVVGTKKFAYDIWGDTVNVASRMETNGKIGRVNISEITYNLVKEKFKCEYRGELAVKNRGQLKMYLVEASK